MKPLWIWIFYILGWGCAYLMFEAANTLWDYVLVVVFAGGLLVYIIGYLLDNQPEEGQNP